MAGVYTVLHDLHTDGRGHLFEVFNESVLYRIDGWQDFKICQTNLVKSNQGAIRGIHRTRSGFPQRKVVTCLEGEINDVLVDLRPESPTFMRHISIELKSELPISILIPERIGHSFQTITEKSMVIYQIDRPYILEEELGISPFDPQIAIKWKPNWLLSEKDAQARDLHEIEYELL